MRVFCFLVLFFMAWGCTSPQEIDTQVKSNNTKNSHTQLPIFTKQTLHSELVLPFTKTVTSITLVVTKDACLVNLNSPLLLHGVSGEVFHVSLPTCLQSIFEIKQIHPHNLATYSNVIDKNTKQPIINRLTRLLNQSKTVVIGIAPIKGDLILVEFEDEFGGYFQKIVHSIELLKS